MDARLQVPGRPRALIGRGQRPVRRPAHAGVLGLHRSGQPGYGLRGLGQLQRPLPEGQRRRRRLPRRGGLTERRLLLRHATRRPLRVGDQERRRDAVRRQPLRPPTQPQRAPIFAEAPPRAAGRQQRVWVVASGGHVLLQDLVATGDQPLLPVQPLCEPEPERRRRARRLGRRPERGRELLERPRPPEQLHPALRHRRRVRCARQRLA
jgi:hypothetical protein